MLTPHMAKVVKFTTMIFQSKIFYLAHFPGFQNTYAYW